MAYFRWNRLRLALGLAATSLTLWLVSQSPYSAPWVPEASLALLQLAGLHLIVTAIFDVLLRRLKLPQLVGDLTVGAGYVVVLIALLGRAGVNLTGIVATSAVVTAVIGFALQDTLANLAGGVTLELERNFMVGDWIRTEQGVGRVTSLHVRHTTIETADKEIIVLPNSVLMRSPVTVIPRSGRRTLVKFPLDFKHNPSMVIAAVEQALQASPIEGMLTDPKPRCVIVASQPSHVDYGVLAWLTNPDRLNLQMSEIQTRVYFALARAGAPLETVAHSIDLHSHTAPAIAGSDETAVRLAALRAVEMFRALSNEETANLAGRLRKEGFALGEVIIREGEQGESLYVLARGRVRILLSLRSGLTEQVGTLEPGDFFGEMSLMTGEARSATVIAMDQVDCYVMEKAHLVETLAKRPELAAELSSILADRQVGLEAARGRLDDAATRQMRTDRGEALLARIRRYFGLG